MNTSGDAAEQVVRFSLEGMEKVIRISGEGAKELIAMMFAALKDKQQTMGKTDLVNMLKSGRNIKIFSIQKQDLAKFAEETKRYGILYCALMDKKNKSNDGVIDIMVREEDAPKVNRIVERFKLAIVDTAMLRTASEKVNEDKEISEGILENDNSIMDEILGTSNIVPGTIVNANDNVMDEILGVEKAESEVSEVTEVTEQVVVYSNEEVMAEILGNPKEKEEKQKNEVTLSSKTENDVPSKHSLKNKGGLEDENRTSVRKELEEIKANALSQQKKATKRTKKAKKGKSKKSKKERGR